MGMIGFLLFANGSLPQAMLKDFTTRGLNEDGSVKWILKGEKANVLGTRVKLEQVLVTIFEGDSTTEIRTPSCMLDRSSQVATGSNRVDVRNRELNMDGTGFDLDLSRKTIFIRKDVRIHYFKTTADVLGSEQEAN